MFNVYAIGRKSSTLLVTEIANIDLFNVLPAFVRVSIRQVYLRALSCTPLQRRLLPSPASPCIFCNSLSLSLISPCFPQQFLI